jgi:hypothetical protein
VLAFKPLIKLIVIIPPVAVQSDMQTLFAIYCVCDDTTEICPNNNNRGCTDKDDLKVTGVQVV